ncbi:MAG: hypothetical protein KBT13_10220, partial [Bacteroidales bacterium]|nr:hypothetical protein [Candidatus Sodaliphilus limicaballi]
ACTTGAKAIAARTTMKIFINLFINQNKYRNILCTIYQYTKIQLFLKPTTTKPQQNKQYSQNPKFTKPPLPLIASEKPPASHRGKRFCRLHHPQKNAPNTGRFSVLAIHRQFAHK